MYKCRKWKPPAPHKFWNINYSSRLFGEKSFDIENILYICKPLFPQILGLIFSYQYVELYFVFSNGSNSDFNSSYLHLLFHLQWTFRSFPVFFYWKQCSWEDYTFAYIFLHFRIHSWTGGLRGHSCVHFVHSRHCCIALKASAHSPFSGVGLAYFFCICQLKTFLSFAIW